MDPSLLTPSPDSLPIHWGWLQFFLVFTFIVHILIMNSMLGASIIALFYSYGNKPEYLSPEYEISRNLPYTIAFTINAGVAPLLFVQVIYGQFIYTSSILMATFWMSIVAVVMAAYYLAYIYDFKFERLSGSSRLYLIVCIVLLLLFIGFVFTNNVTLMLHPEKWSEYFSNTKGTILNLSDPILYPRYLHFVIGSIAVGGLSIALYHKYIHKGPYSQTKINIGMSWFFHATLFQIADGIWFLLALPKEIMWLFLGNNWIATGLLAVGVGFSFFSLLFGYQKRVVASTVTLITTVCIMAVMREILKSVYLKPYFSLNASKIEPQYSPFIMFIIIFIIGLFLIGYMFKLSAMKVKGD